MPMINSTIPSSKMVKPDCWFDLEGRTFKGLATA